MRDAVLSGVLALAVLARAPTMTISTAHNSPAELRTKAQLEKVLADYDLHKYLFTTTAVIEERAINHAFPTLTLNARFADSEDELLASFVHEQYHWHLRDRQAAMQNAVADLRRRYPHVPVGGTEGAETEYSTYGHIVDCYLEIVTVRALMGPERTAAAVADKGHYTWIYATIVKDEPAIAALVDRYGLRIK